MCSSMKWGWSMRIAVLLGLSALRFGTRCATFFHAQLLSLGRQYECSVGVGSGLVVVPITGGEVTFDH